MRTGAGKDQHLGAARVAERPAAAGPSRWMMHAQALLVLSFVLLLPAKTLYQLPVILMAIGGAWVLIARREALPSRGLAVLAGLFGCLWVPMLVAALDALDPARSMKSVALYPRFFLAGVFILYALQDPCARRWIWLGVFGICAFWTLDGLVQFLLGFNVLGYPYEGGQLTGIFHPKYRLGPSLAVFTPVLLDVVLRRRWVHPAWGAVLVLVPVVIGLTLHRNSWVMLALALTGYGVFLVVATGWRPRPWSVVGGGLVVMVMAGAISQHGGFSERLGKSLDALAASPEALEVQLGQRPDIWRTAVNTFSGNWVNGIGSRGFRSGYRQYADPDDYWLRLTPPQIPAHPHQILLEVAAETGVIGVLGYALLFVIAFGVWRRARRDRAIAAAPWLIGFTVVAFPANVSKAFYGSGAASLTWWLLVVGLAILLADAGECPGRAKP